MHGVASSARATSTVKKKNHTTSFQFRTKPSSFLSIGPFLAAACRPFPGPHIRNVLPSPRQIDASLRHGITSDRSKPSVEHRSNK